jgi:hypothetical protein
MLDDGYHFVADAPQLAYQMLAFGVGHDVNGDIDIAREANLGANGNGEPPNERIVDA